MPLLLSLARLHKQAFKCSFKCSARMQLEIRQCTPPHLADGKRDGIKVRHRLLDSQEAEAFIAVGCLGTKGVAFAVVPVLDEQQQAAFLLGLVHEDGRVGAIQRALTACRRAVSRRLGMEEHPAIPGSRALTPQTWLQFAAPLDHIHSGP